MWLDSLAGDASATHFRLRDPHFRMTANHFKITLRETENARGSVVGERRALVWGSAFGEP